MHEDLGTILNKGYGTWSRNLNIALPFFLNTMFSFLIVMLLMFTLAAVFAASSMSDISSASAEEMMDLFGSLILDNLLSVIAMVLIFVLLSIFIQSYFTAGAIGMARSALQTGHSSFSDMFLSGKENVVNLFLTKVLVIMLIFAGVVFLIPGILTAGELSELLSNPESAVLTSILLGFGVLIWLFYIIVMSIVLSFVDFSLVLDRLDPISAIEKGLSFFMQNKLDVFILYVLMVSFSILINVIGELVSSIEVVSTVWALISFILSFAVIQPLIAVWFTRLYLNRNEREIYDVSDLLAYP